MHLVLLTVKVVVVVKKGREIGGAPEDRDDVVQFGSAGLPCALATLTRLNPELQFWKCPQTNFLRATCLKKSLNITQ